MIRVSGSMAGTLGKKNTFRYRGYYSDEETGLYYLKSRYDNPKMYRFISADGYISTGQGLVGYNMFSYCGNNPINRADPSGKIFGLVVGIVGVLFGSAFLGGCSAEPEAEPYSPIDEAAKEFSESIYSSSLYIRHEYITEIYSINMNGKTVYHYTVPRAGKPHSVSLGYSIPSGAQLVAYAHTHPNYSEFSYTDKEVAQSLNLDLYVVGPDLNLQRYDPSTNTVTNLGSITPVTLTDNQKEKLVADFRVSWENHLELCGEGCKYKSWPTP